MNSGYELVMQGATIEVLMASTRTLRQQLMNEFIRLKNQPFSKGERIIRDLSGREHQVCIVGKWEIVFWADHAVKELRVVRLRKI